MGKSTQHKKEGKYKRKKEMSEKKKKENLLPWVTAGKKISKKEQLSSIFILAIKYVFLCLAAGLLLYNDFRFGLCFLPGFLIYYNQWKKRENAEEKYQRMVAFRDALTSLGACLEAGYAMENAIVAAKHDLECLYSEQSWICMEFAAMKRAVENSIPMEEVFRGFAVRSELEDAAGFAELYATAKRSGGDLLQIIRSTNTVVSDKAEVKREIRTILTAKQLECKVMRMIPPGILLYFQVFSPGFLDLLYRGVLGRGVMTILFLFYLALAWLMGRITEIEM